MDGAVGKLVGRDDVPQIEIGPAISGSFVGHHRPPLIVGPARIKEIVAQVAVRSGADEHRFVEQNDRHISRGFESRRQHIEGQLGFIQRGPRPTVEGHIGIEVDLGRGIVGRIGLVDAGGGPEHAVHLQAEQVGQVAALTDEGLVPPPRLDEGRVVRVEGQAIAGDQIIHAGSVVGDNGRGQLLVDRERFEGHAPDDQVRVVAQGIIEHHQVLGQGDGRVAQVVDAHRAPVGSRQPGCIELPGEGLFGTQERAPGGRVANDDHAVLVRQFLPGSNDVRGEHGIQVEQAQVIGLGRVLAKGEPLTPGEQAVIKGHFPQAGRHGDQGKVEHQKKRQALENYITQETGIHSHSSYGAVVSPRQMESSVRRARKLRSSAPRDVRYTPAGSRSISRPWSGRLLVISQKFM